MLQGPCSGGVLLAAGIGVMGELLLEGVEGGGEGVEGGGEGGVLGGGGGGGVVELLVNAGEVLGQCVLELGCGCGWGTRVV